jgi:valyl-tRNA synthetase
MMPFLTEELWQRLPRRPSDTTPSIVLASYPQYSSSLDSPESEAAYELVMNAAKGIRSLMAEYAIKTDAQAYIHALTPSALHTLEAEKASIESLCGKGLSSTTILQPSDSKPSGCVLFSVSAAAVVFLHVQGRVDIEAEVSKATTKLKKADEGAARQTKLLADEGFRKHVKLELKLVEERKLEDYESEKTAWKGVLEQMESLRLE